MPTIKIIAIAEGAKIKKPKVEKNIDAILWKIK
jgi:hypothetical protein